MERMLIHIPRLYSKVEFINISSMIPKDYETKSEEFWSYVEEKLRPFTKRVNRIYLESIEEGGNKGIKMIKRNLEVRIFQIVKKLVENGGKLEATEDKTLILETLSWLAMLGDNPNLGVIMDLYQESLIERDDYIAEVINRTLKDDEIGVIIIEPTHRINLPEDVKVIKMCRFDPSDYLKIFLQEKNLINQ